MISLVIQMKVLQRITDFNNGPDMCPVSIGSCELLYDSENVRMLLRISLVNGESLKLFSADVCCYDREGALLSVMKDVAIGGEETTVTLPSLMTKAVVLVARRAEFENGLKWESEAEIPKQIEVSAEDAGAFDDTAKFDSVQVAGEKAEPLFSKKELRQIKNAREEEIRQIIKNDPVERKKRIITRIVVFVVIAALIGGGFFALKYKNDADAAYKFATNLYNGGKFEEAIPKLEAATDYIYSKEKKDELYWMLAMAYSRQRNFYDGAVYYSKLGDYKESNVNYKSIGDAFAGIISAGDAHTIGLCSDGTVVAAGNNDVGQCDTEEWTDITKVSAGSNHSVALTREGEVVATGGNRYGQCDVEKWNNIISISAGTAHTLGVKNSGYVVFAGSNEYGQGDVEDWSGIVSVSAGDKHSVGLCSDGTVISTGSNEYGQCDTDEWTDVMFISAGRNFTAALTYDGKLLITGDIKAKKASDILFMATGEHDVLTVSPWGQVSAAGSNDSNQNMTSIWKNIVAVDGGSRHSVGVDRDGKVYGTGDNSYGQISLDSWTDIKIPKNTVSIKKWNNE